MKTLQVIYKDVPYLSPEKLSSAIQSIPKTQGFYTLGASWRDTNGIGRIVRYIHIVIIAKTKST